MANPYVFIVGCPRSGTTLLQRMVDAHPDIAITPETHWIPKLFKERSGLTSDGLVTPQLIPHLLELPRFTRLGIDLQQLLKLMANAQSIHYSEFVTQVFDLYGKAHGKALVGDKTPGYVRSLPTLHTLWPSVRFVHLIRDGRDVCLSVANWRKTSYKRPGNFTTWNDDSVATAALWWEAMVRLGRQAGNSLGRALYYEIRYEFLVNNPTAACSGLCAFLDLPYDDRMLRFHEGRTKNVPGLDAKHAWLPVTPGLRDWRSQMPADDLERFEAGVGGLLDELGYPRAFPRPRTEKLENASRIRSLLVRDPSWFHHSREGRAEGAGVSASKRKENPSNGNA